MSGGPARHEVPGIDEAALAAARHADRLLASAVEQGDARWAGYLRSLPDLLREAGPAELRRVAMRARAAYGPKDSIRDALPASVTEPFLESVDRLIRVLARRELHR